MSTLNVTLIDVGWGDSIFIESINNQGDPFYALVDSNDTPNCKSSYIFLKKFFERANIDLRTTRHIFDFILLSHAHSDHGAGLKQIMKDFGTKYFYYPKSLEWSSLSALLDFANRSSNVEHHESLNSTKILPKIGDVDLQVLWPNWQDNPSENENNNSVVLNMQLGGVSMLLSGDSEHEVWESMINRIPTNVKVFKVPHHGSVNGSFDDDKNPCYLNSVHGALLGISSHIRPFGHPHPDVIQLFESNHFEYFRTDTEYHITFSTDGTNVQTKYSHFH